MSISGGCAVRTLEASKLDAVFEGEHRMTAIYSPSGQLVYALFGSKMENKLIGYKIRCYSKQHQRWLEMVPPLGGLVMEPMHMMWMTMLTSTSFLVSGITEIRSAYCTRKFLHFGTNPPRWTLLEKLTTAVHMNDRWAYDRQNRRVYLFSHENFSLTPQVSIFCIDFSGLNSPEPERTLVFDGQVPWSFRPHTPMVFCEHNNYLLLVNTGNAKLSAEQDKNTPVQIPVFSLNARRWEIVTSQGHLPDSQLPTFPGARIANHAKVFDNKAYVFGGRSVNVAGGHLVNDLWSLDLRTLIWERLERKVRPMHLLRGDMCDISCEGELLMFGHVSDSEPDKAFTYQL